MKLLNFAAAVILALSSAPIIAETAAERTLDDQILADDFTNLDYPDGDKIKILRDSIVAVEDEDGRHKYTVIFELVRKGDRPVKLMAEVVGCHNQSGFLTQIDVANGARGERLAWSVDGSMRSDNIAFYTCGAATQKKILDERRTTVVQKVIAEEPATTTKKTGTNKPHM